MIATRDAWNRLDKLVNTDSSQTLAEFVYDGRNFRLVNKEYVSGTLSAMHFLSAKVTIEIRPKGRAKQQLLLNGKAPYQRSRIEGRKSLQSCQ